MAVCILAGATNALSQTGAPASDPPKNNAAGSSYPYLWKKLPTEPYRGKQDDIFFITPTTGWYVNGLGKIYKTTDGGSSWQQKLNQPGTYFRCIGFTDSLRGFAGNIGTEYFPNVSDTIPLYQTYDGGDTWSPVRNITGPAVKGLCAIDILKEPFINAGYLDHKTHIYAGGRVGGPAYLLRSDDGGDSWQSTDLSMYCGMITDIKFFDTNNGIICAATSPAVQESHALILMTTDGGTIWKKVYQSERPYEITWKASFPTRQTGYVTIQNYNPDSTITKRVVAKTTDGGKSWQEIALDDDFKLREFGVGFIDENRGWVGATTGGYETTDGGKSWRKTELGKAANKIRLMKTDNGFIGYAIGVDVYKLDYQGR